MESETKAPARTVGKLTQQALNPTADVHPLLQLYTEQVDAYYSITDKPWSKTKYRFSPSEAAKCPRELFYAFMGEEAQPKPKTPLQNRVPTAGDGVHAVRQAKLLEMERVLPQRGIPIRFRIKRIDGKPAIETSKAVEIDHKGEHFTVSGRADAIIEFIDENGEIIGQTIWDLKTKTLKKKLSPKNLEKEVAKYAPQMVCYKILFDIDHAILEFESLQKEWGDEPNADVRRVLLELTDDLVREVLDKFAYVTACVRTETLPEMEADSYYCANFCPYEAACHRDSLATGLGAV